MRRVDCDLCIEKTLVHGVDGDHLQHQDKGKTLMEINFPENKRTCKLFEKDEGLYVI